MELVKEEDKNILLAIYGGPVTSQFAGFGNIYIMLTSGRGPTNANNPGD
jgi:hypothetical protein